MWHGPGGAACHFVTGRAVARFMQDASAVPVPLWHDLGAMGPPERGWGRGVPGMHLRVRRLEPTGGVPGANSGVRVPLGRACTSIPPQNPLCWGQKGKIRRPRDRTGQDVPPPGVVRGPQPA